PARTSVRTPSSASHSARRPSRFIGILPRLRQKLDDPTDQGEAQGLPWCKAAVGARTCHGLGGGPTVTRSTSTTSRGPSLGRSRRQPHRAKVFDNITLTRLATPGLEGSRRCRNWVNTTRRR